MYYSSIGLYESMASSLQKGASYGVSLLVPESPALFLIGTAAWYYGRCVAITYAPGAVANHFIQITVVFMKSITIGKAVGTAVIAPILTPQVLPFVIEVTGCGAFAVVVIIGNLMLRHLLKKKEEAPKKEAPEKPLKKKPEAKVEAAVKT